MSLTLGNWYITFWSVNNCSGLPEDSVWNTIIYPLCERLESMNPIRRYINYFALCVFINLCNVKFHDIISIANVEAKYVLLKCENLFIWAILWKILHKCNWCWVRSLNTFYNLCILVRIILILNFLIFNLDEYHSKCCFKF